ncbi:MAG TPA: hypothetical protein VGI98_05225 [Candidatus Limnocylindrales bacterium]
MKPRVRRGIVAALAACSLALVVIAPALAAPLRARVTYGDVRALFEARTTANQVQLAKGLSVSAPRTAFLRARINPFFDGQAYCDRDWLILLVSFVGDEHLQSTKAIRAHTSVDFVLDGSPVATRQTPVKRFLAADRADFFFGWTVARFYAPGSLADGPHALETTFHYPDGSSDVLDVTFGIGGGSDVCG